MNFMYVSGGNLPDDGFPSHLLEWNDGNVTCQLPGSVFGYVLEQTTIFKKDVFDSMTVKAGMYFCLEPPFKLIGGRGFGVCLDGHRAFNLIGGPIEAVGRLNYIDGCTDSLLISPIMLGDPCLNHLHFPPNIRQTMHTHPSNRVGCVIRGKGRCVTPTEEIPLVPGKVFCIPKDGHHCFYTDSDSMDVVAWHPDSDFGPKHEQHPMVNRTFVDGLPANESAKYEAIRTR